MCGICGVRRFGPDPITVDQIRLLLCSLESRGQDAAGVALVKGDKIVVDKLDAPASHYVSTKAFEKFVGEHLDEETEMFLGHTRYATQGSPRRNRNNHPLWSGKSAVVHNGVIWNDKSLFSSLKLDRKADTDSDIIRAIVDEHGLTRAGLKALNKLSGSCAAAIVSKDYPGMLMLLKSGSPLVLAATEHQLLWASKRESLHLATRPWIQRHGAYFQSGQSPAGFRSVPEDTALLFGPNGQEWHERFASCATYTPPIYRVYEKYEERIRKWNGEQVVRCPNPECGKWVTIPDRLKSWKLHELICKTCDSPLAKEEEEVAS